MSYIRNIDLGSLLNKKSVLLLGPRSTGKSFYIRNQLNNTHVINLLKNAEFMRLSSDPDSLEGIVKLNPNKIIVIDEIQKLPLLLDSVHRLIEEYGTRFLLTSSSARKLKSSGVNLLAGRAWLANMYPLNYLEIKNKDGDFNLEKYLNLGSLPQVWTSQDPYEELDSYVQTYIDLELKAEGIVRKIPQFSRFLTSAAISSGQTLNFQGISSDTGVSASTIKEYYRVLEDTLLGHMLTPWLAAKKRKSVKTAKFYFFDTGVLNQITNTPSFKINSHQIDGMYLGNRFEHFIVNEVLCINSYLRNKKPIHFWRSSTGHEVDLIYGDIAIEIKSATKVSAKHLKGLKVLRQENMLSKYIVVSRDPVERIEDDIYCLHYKSALEKLWIGEL